MQDCSATREGHEFDQGIILLELMVSSVVDCQRMNMNVSQPSISAYSLHAWPPVHVSCGSVLPHYPTVDTSTAEIISRLINDRK